MLRLPIKPPEVLGVAGEAVGENLDRDRPAEALVEGQPDDSHPAVSEPAFEPVPLAEKPTGGDQRRFGERRPSPGRLDFVGRSGPRAPRP